MAGIKHTKYENNPFTIGVKGLELFFKRSHGIAIYSVIMTIVISLLTLTIVSTTVAMTLRLSETEIQSMNEEDLRTYRAFVSPDSPDDVLVPIVREVGSQFISLVFALLLFSVLDYAAAKNAKGENTNLGEAFKQVLVQFPAYLWTYIIVGIKVFLWSLLLIVPGIIMFYRYRLTGTVFFAEGKAGNAATKRSAELTKGRWLTTYASTSIWSILTLGLGHYIFMSGTRAILYQQFSASDTRKPAHWLSWLTFLAPILFIVTMLVLVALVGVLAIISAAP